MANELFELTKLDSPGLKLQYTETDMHILLKHMADEYTILFSQRGINFKAALYGGKYIIQADTALFSRAVQNLLDNAGKYTEDNNVFMEAYIKEEKGKQVLFICISNKIQDAANIQLDSVFERFYKGDKARSNTDSSGLGLAITKRIVKLHNGDISVRTEGEYIYFQVTVPVIQEILF